MRTGPPRAVAGTALALVLSVGLVSGCAEDDAEPDAQTVEPSDPAQAETSPSPDETAEESTEEPTEEPSGESSATEAAGDRLSGDGYTFAKPEGWNDITSSYEDSAIRIDNAVQAQADSPAGAGTNINVIREAPEGLPDLQTLAPQLAQQLKTVAQVEPEPLDPIELDGEPAIGHTATGSSPQGKLTFVQRFTIHDGALYSITLTSDPKSAKGARKALDGVLASWTWER